MATAPPVTEQSEGVNLSASEQPALNGTKDSVNEDSDDDKPLAFRLVGKVLGSSNLNGPVKKPDLDPEDNKPIGRNLKVLSSKSPPTKASPTSSRPSTAPASSRSPATASKSAAQKPGALKTEASTSKDPSTSSKSPVNATKSPVRTFLKRPGKVLEDSESAKKKVKSEAVQQNAKKRPLEQKEASASTSSKKPKVEKNDSSSSEDEDEDDDYEDDEEDVPKRSQKTIVKKSLTATTAGKKKVVETKVSKKTVVQKGTKSKTAPGSGGGKKWTTLEHNGVIFPPPYQPHGVKMLYDGQPVDLTPAQEEVATMYAVMKDTDYISKPKFNSNFWLDWKKILGPNHVIKKLELCDFTPIYEWYQKEKEKKKQMTSAEKKQMREEKAKLEEKYTWALVDGVKEKVGNFRVEPPGLFRGRGEHPKMGKLKRRIFPENIVINIGKDAPVPECPMPGHKWKEIRHDNTVTWLAFWNDPINEKECKYVFLHPSSSLKAQSDMKKYEKARMLKDYIDNIRRTYTKDFTSSDPGKRQIAVATYLIDRLALRAGNEKDDDEADTVGCCSLKVEHVKLLPSKKIEFDFLGKDSIRYYNEVLVEEKVYKAIGDFKKGKKKGDDLFDKLDTNKLNAHLKEFMPELTAKVFRTYNASITLDSQLVHTVGSNIMERISDYQRANKEVAILCNHQRTVSKSHGAQMEKLEGKMAELKALREELARDLERAKKGKPPLKDADGKTKRNQSPEQLEKKLEQTDTKIQKMELDMKTKDDLKTVALGTSKINYLDPRITVAWCKRNEVPIEKVFTKSLLQKFAWAMDVEPTYRF